MRPIVLSLAVLTAIAGCSADPGSGSDRRSTPTSSTKKTSSGSAGAGGSGAPTTSGTFANSTAKPAAPSTTPASPDAGTCVQGMRCYDNSTPDKTDCGHQTLDSTVKKIDMPGNVLVIFDRSGSMDQDWNGTPKYQAAGNALNAALMPLQDLLTVGGVFFPSLDMGAGSCTCDITNPIDWIPGIGGCCLMLSAGSCAVNTIDKPDEISFRPGAQFIAELPNQWRLQGSGMTPLETGVMRAQEAIAGTTFVGPLSIVILTDGQPNCGTTNQNVIDQVTRWSGQGYKTYVVGLPGAQGASALLDQLATAGGTDKYIDPADPAALQMKLGDIASETVKKGIDTCDINLAPPAEVPNKLHLVVHESGMDEDVPRVLSSDSGWSVTSDGGIVTLKGSLCDDAKGGRFDSLRFEFGCVELPPLPPTKPPS
jgi:hypothetical protein